MPTQPTKISRPKKTDKPYRGKRTPRVNANLDLLMGEEQTPPSSISLKKIVLPKQQPRHYFDPDKLNQLTASIEQHGILEPLLVRPIDKDKYELVAGERRLRAAIQLKFTEVPVIIKELSDENALQIALVENLQREDLNPVEETEGILSLLSVRLKLTLDEVISLLYQLQNEMKGKLTDNVVGKSEKEIINNTFAGLMSFESFMTHRLRLLNLPENILEVVREGKIAYTKAIAIAKVKNEKQRDSLLTEAIESNLSLKEIKDKIQQLQPKQADSDSPKNRVNKIIKDINKAKLWEKEPKKWQRVNKLLEKIESLLE